MEIHYKNKDGKYKLLAKGFVNKQKAEDWAKTYSDVFNCQCKIVR